jgi:hypothetical protein
MKRNILIAVLTLVVVLTTKVFSQYPATNPTYTATLKNDALSAPNQYEFDIFIKHTGGGAPFECQGAQIGLLFNNLIKGSGILSAVYIAGTSQMVAGQIPSNPTLATVTGDANTGVFRIAPKAVLIPGDGTVISIIGDGTRLGRFRISTTAAAFDILLANFEWNFLTTSGRYPSKIAAWIQGATQVDAAEITVEGSHSMELFNLPLPVELTTFNISTQGRDINLSWQTHTEVNTYKFQIERTQKGNQNWVKVGELAASGNSNSTKGYSFTDTKLNSGKYIYRLKMIDNNGTFRYSDVAEAQIELPKDYLLSQNYPNAFNPTTRIDYQLPVDSKVTIELYGIDGEKVTTLVSKELSAGYYTVEINASELNLASGVYIYRMNTQNSTDKNFVQVKKLMLMK